MRFLADESCDFCASARATLAHTVVDVVAKLSGGLTSAFVVIEPGRARISRVPTDKA